jgi:hypothetical protein
MNRAANGSDAILMRRQHVDDLHTGGDEFQHFAMIDDSQLEEAAILDGSPLAKGTTCG